MQAKDVYKTVSSRIQDLSLERRWPWEAPISDVTPSLQDFLNNALYNIVMQRPDATSTFLEKTLVDGARQSLADDELSLFECVRFISADGLITRAITRIDRSEMDAFMSDWYSEDDDTGVWHWAYEKRHEPKVFWVFPKAVAGGKVEVIVSRLPTLITSPNDTITIPEIYKGALDAWILYEILMGDTEDYNPNKAMHFYESFFQILGVKLSIDRSYPAKRSEGDLNVS